ncbi:MAG: DUF2815 family protein [Bacillota bacterium]|nr:DUF2815 family protein [Bacillota bacterium]
MANINIQDVVTGKVRLSYVHLFTPYASQQGGEPKYSTTILVPKTDIATKQRIDAAINTAIQEGVASRWNGVRPPVIAIPVYDGDGVRPSDGMPFGEECKGHWVFTASSKQAPEIVDLTMQRILNATEIYSGIYARVSVRFFPYASNGKKGIGCGLGPVQKIEDGEPLGGRISAATAFGDNVGQSPMTAQASAYAQPSQYPGQPVYNTQMSGYGQNSISPQQQSYQTPQPAYGQPMQQANPQNQVAIDPITGAPVNGGVMGI